MAHKRSPERQEQIDAHIPVDQFISSNIRRTCRAGFEVSLDHLTSVARGEGDKTSPFASIRAAALLAQHGMGKQPQIYIDNYSWLKTVCDIASKHFESTRAYDAWINEVIANLENNQ